MSEYQGKHSAPVDDVSRLADVLPTKAASRFSRRNARSNAHRRTNSDLPGAVFRAQESFEEDAPTQQHDQPYEERNQAFVGYRVTDAARKQRPARTLMLVAAALVVLAVILFGGFRLAQSLGIFGVTPVSGDDREVSVFIPEGSTTAEIASILSEAEVISQEASFISAVLERGVESRFQSGKYTLRAGMTDGEVIDALLAGPTLVGAEGNKLTIPEGLTLEATAACVEKACGIAASEFIAEAYSADKYLADYPFLEGVYNNSLEGFLYPKTYMIPTGSNAEYVVRVLLDQFAIETSGIDMSYAASKNLTLFDLVTMASMIEKETAAPEERPVISSVLYNRLHEGMMLQICSTVVYAIGLENYDGHPLLETDLATESPYNTYLSTGLPAGPICSPRFESIEAAAHPNETNYLYYVLTSEEGTHTFCATYEEFEVANALYHELFNVPN
jgi:UPF0755 protein